MNCPFNIKAKNGNNSILFKEMVDATNNPAEAVNLYYTTFTQPFKDIFGDWTDGKVPKKLDANGEPKWSELSAEKWLFDKDFAKGEELDVKAETYKKILGLQKKLQNSLADKIQGLRARNSAGLHDTIRKLELVLEQVNEGMLSDSIPAFLEGAKSHIDNIQAQMVNESYKEKPDFHKLAGLNRAAQSYNVLHVIQAELINDPEVRRILLNTSFNITASEGKMQDIQAMYINAAKNYLADEIYKRNKQWTKKQVREWLDTAPEDISFTDRMFETMQDAKDQVIAAVGNIIMESEHKKRRASIEFTEELQEVTEALENKHGKQKAADMFAKILVDRPDGEVHILNLAAKDTKGADKAQDEIYKKVQEIRRDPELYQFLDFFYTKYSKLQAMLPPGKRMGTRIPSIPKASWERAQGKDMKEVATMFADDVKKTIKSSNNDMQRGMLTDITGQPVKRIPIFYSNKYDSVDFKEFFTKKYETLIKEGKSEEDAEVEATTYAELEATKKNSQLISRDLAFVLQGFHEMAVNYAYKNEIINVVDAAQDVVGSDYRKYTLLDNAGKPIQDVHGDIQYKGGSQSKAAKMLSKFVDTKVYGMVHEDLGTKTLLGIKDVDVDKLLRQINNSASMINLAGNIFAAIPNIGNGEYNNFMEAIGGEFYTVKNYKKTSKLYRNNLAGVLGDIGQRTPKNFVNLMDEYYNMMQDYNPRSKVMVTEGTTAKRMMKTNMLFFMNSAGEHFMQIRTSMSIMDNIMTYNKAGAETGSLLDAHTEENGKLVIKKGIYVKGKDGELVGYNDEQKDRIGNKMNAVTRKLYGNYSSLTANEMKSDARLALFTKFRDWAAEGIWRRFGGKQPYLNLEQESEGFYRTGGRVGLQMIKDLRHLQFSMMKENWANLTPHEKANIRRAVTEGAAVVLLGVSSALLAYAGKNIEDEFDGDNLSDRLVLGSFKLLEYDVNRLYSELFAYLNPVEALRIARNPVAASSIAENVIKLVTQVLTDPLEQYDTGWREGEYKTLVRGEKLVPLYKHMKVLNPDGIQDKGIFYEL